MDWWRMFAGVLVGFALVYGVLLLLLWRYARAHPDTVRMREALRLLPDLLRLLRRLLADRTLGAGVRVRIALLVVYLAVPFDLVPDVVPVIGYADDAVVVALVLRSVVRRAGPEALRRHWPGTPEGLDLVLRLAGQGSSS
jgi:uncharacterized membrane protein YkvA (DUF1232 family)